MRCPLLLFLVLALTQCTSAPTTARGVPAKIAVTSIVFDIGPPGSFGGSRPGFLAEVIVIRELNVRCVIAFTGSDDPQLKYQVSVSHGSWSRDDEPTRDDVMIPQDLAQRMVALAGAEKPDPTERYRIAAALLKRGLISKDPLQRHIRHLNKQSDGAPTKAR